MHFIFWKLLTFLENAHSVLFVNIERAGGLLTAWVQRVKAISKNGMLSEEGTKLIAVNPIKKEETMLIIRLNRL